MKPPAGSTLDLLRSLTTSTTTTSTTGKQHNQNNAHAHSHAHTKPAPAHKLALTPARKLTPPRANARVDARNRSRPRRTHTLLAITASLHALLWASIAALAAAVALLVGVGGGNAGGVGARSPALVQGLGGAVAALLSLAYTALHALLARRQRLHGSAVVAEAEKPNAASRSHSRPKSTYLAVRLAGAVCAAWLLALGWDMIVVARAPVCAKTAVEAGWGDWRSGRACVVGRVGVGVGVVALMAASVLFAALAVVQRPFEAGLFGRVDCGGGHVAQQQQYQQRGKTGSSSPLYAPSESFDSLRQEKDPLDDPFTSSTLSPASSWPQRCSSLPPPTTTITGLGISCLAASGGGEQQQQPRPPLLLASAWRAMHPPSLPPAHHQHQHHQQQRRASLSKASLAMLDRGRSSSPPLQQQQQWPPWPPTALQLLHQQAPPGPPPAQRVSVRPVVGGPVVVCVGGGGGCGGYAQQQQRRRWSGGYGGGSVGVAAGARPAGAVWGGGMGVGVGMGMNAAGAARGARTSSSAASSSTARSPLCVMVRAEEVGEGEGEGEGDNGSESDDEAEAEAEAEGEGEEEEAGSDGVDDDTTTTTTPPSSYTKTPPHPQNPPSSTLPPTPPRPNHHSQHNPLPHPQRSSETTVSSSCRNRGSGDSDELSLVLAILEGYGADEEGEGREGGEGVGWKDGREGVGEGRSLQSTGDVIKGYVSCGGRA